MTNPVPPYLIALAIITYVPDLSLIGVRYLLAKG